MLIICGKTVRRCVDIVLSWRLCKTKNYRLPGRSKPRPYRKNDILWVYYAEYQ